MIRVIARHVEDAKSILVGDFAPSEVRPLMELLDEYPVNLFEPESETHHEESSLFGAQIVTMGGRNACRVGLEIIFDD